MKKQSIKVAPLHIPKPNLPLAQLAKDSELYSTHPSNAPQNPHLTYNGGALLTNVSVYTIFWGKNWSKQASFTALMKSINAFFSTILTSTLMDQMSEYSVKGKQIGHGQLAGSKVITANSPVRVIDDSAIQAALSGWIASGVVPKQTPNTLYFIYTDKGVKVTMGGSSSCSSFCGYHDHISRKIFYAVMPFPSCAGCLGGMSVLDAITGTSSHELCEAITDPIPSEGWYDNNNGEIGDICAWQFKKIGVYNVQKEWSNKSKACV